MGALGRAIAILLLLATVSCAGGPPPPAQRPAPTATPTAPAVRAAFPAGAYQAADSSLYVVNALGHLVRTTDGWVRQLSIAGKPGRYTIGTAFQVPSPVEAEVDFTPSDEPLSMTVKPLSGSGVDARRIDFKATDIRVPDGDIELAATITESRAPGPHPGIVIVHGSERGTRDLYGVWVYFYASLGFTVLAYDKRGAGASGGRFPGDLATSQTLDLLAGDAAACWRLLTSWPGVDAARVGFHGGSQGGWTVPLAMSKVEGAAFAILVNGPAVTPDQQGSWAALTDSSRQWPTQSAAEIAAALSDKGSGYDPGPVLAGIAAPVLWLNSELDGQVPTALNTKVLEALAKPNFDVVVFAGTGHALLQTGTGLATDDDRATHFPPDLFPRLKAWLSAQVGSEG